MKNGQKSIDLTGRRLIAMRDVQDALAAGANSILAAQNCVVTPSARDFLQQHGIELGAQRTPAAIRNAPANARPLLQPPAWSPVNRRLFSTPEAEEIKKEICAVGRKLWMRQFVDGNGGNISYRIGPMKFSARRLW